MKAGGHELVPVAGSLAGRIAVITGAAGDIGAATAVVMVERGASIVAVDRDVAGLARLHSLLPDGAAIETIVADVSDEAAVHHVFDAAAARFGGIDIVFNNAGIEGGPDSTWKLTRDYPLAEFSRILAVNVAGVFLVMKHAIGHLEQRGGGAIVNSCSIYGVKGAAGQIAYVASKHAVLGMTRTAAAECGAAAIRINCIGPAVIRGGMMDRLIAAIEANRPPDPAAPSGFVHPLQRWCEPREVAQLVAFLVSDEARFITGGYHAIDGGLGAI